ncbi:zinc finger BED domain-containing protein 4-like [Palaemon carinicauda]|uniref:zinc finger BED domain-containing protein 4-like n=1 Tax=Palaemon carinicauda TaxID=392227 RepID=UPI0035B58699
MVRAFVCLPGLYGNEVTKESIDEKRDTDNLDILEEKLDLNEVLVLLPPDRSSYFAHTQQLCIRNAFNDPCVRNSGIATVIQKCCSIVAALRRSTVAAPFLEKIGVSLLAANATRWNSQLTMLKSVLKDVNGVNSAIRLLGSCKTVEELKGMKIAMLIEVIKVLEPFQEATSQVEGENMVKLSCVAPVVFGLKHSLKLFAESKPIYCLNLADALQSSIKKRLHPFLEKTDVIVAAVMDPRFKLAWLPCEEIKKEKISKIVDLIISKSTQSSLKNTIPEREPFITISTNQDKADMSAKRPRLFANMPPAGKINVSASTSDTTVVKAELASYLEEGVLAFNVNPMRYWRENKSFSILKPFARNILGCCATSAPSERVFSKAGNFYTPERAKLSPETFRALMISKGNYDI